MSALASEQCVDWFMRLPVYTHMVIGITGNFGVGKTTVAGMFRRLGARIIDADPIAHKIIRPYTPAYRKIIACFGRGVLAGIYISRRRLARIAFLDKERLTKLNKIMHPEIIRIIKNRIRKFSINQIIVVDGALLIESGLPPRQLLKQRSSKKIWRRRILPWIDKLIVVKSEPNIQIQRLKKSGLTDDVIEKRLNVQLSQDKRIGFADFVIDNSGRRSQTQKQVKEIWDKIIINRGG